MSCRNKCWTIGFWFQFKTNFTSIQLMLSHFLRYFYLLDFYFGIINNYSTHLVALVMLERSTGPAFQHLAIQKYSLNVNPLPIHWQAKFSTKLCHSSQHTHHVPQSDSLIFHVTDSFPHILISVPNDKFTKLADGLLVKKVSRDDSGEYTCKAFQVSTTISNVQEQTIRLNVQRK